MNLVSLFSVGRNTGGARNKYLYGPAAVVVSGLAVGVCEFSVFINGPTGHELLL